MKSPKVEIKSLENRPIQLSKEYLENKIEELMGLQITYSNRARLQIIKQEFPEWSKFVTFV